MAQPVVFFNYQTLTPDILSVLALATLEPKMPDSMEHLPASSSIVFEVFKDGTIKGYKNDQPYTILGCASADEPC